MALVITKTRPSEPAELLCFRCSGPLYCGYNIQTIGHTIQQLRIVEWQCIIHQLHIIACSCNSLPVNEMFFDLAWQKNLYMRLFSSWLTVLPIFTVNPTLAYLHNFCAITDDLLYLSSPHSVSGPMHDMTHLCHAVWWHLYAVLDWASYVMTSHDQML